MSELVGQALGQYRVVELIGQGGMARVYKAYQSALERYVAIKAIPTHLDNAQENDFVQRFTVEAKLVARVSHPHIVPVHDFGEDDGWAYIVMEYVGNGTLRERLVQAETNHRHLALSWSLLMAEQAAQALDFAHTCGIIHRDVKPGNMLLRSDDHLLLSDFGIATILAVRRALTNDNESTVGTPQYMAPEQGAADGVVDGRTDIYALGVVLFQCVTGNLPFLGDTPMTTIMKHMHQPPPRPSTLVPGLPAAVEQIILRALEKDPALRYQRAADMAADLRAARTELRLGIRTRTPTIPIGEAATGVYGRAYPVFQPPLGTPGAPGTCFRCGAANNPQHRYCTNCGYELSGRRASVDTFLGANGRPLRCRLAFQAGPLAGRSYVLHQDTTTVGRAGGNDVIIPDGTVSRRHARLNFANGVWYVEDVGSSNGTHVNGVPIQHAVRLEDGDELRFGDEIVAFSVVS